MSLKEDKMEVDLSPLVDVKIPELRKIAIEEKNLARALESLLAVEKQARTAGDAVSTGRLLETAVELCFELNDQKALRENITLLSKRRGQLKAATKKMVKKAMTYLDKLDQENKMALLDVLMKVTEGKIFVEKQSARLSMILAKIKEGEGKVAEAATILQEVQVETFGSMKKKEKTNFILEQMRLCLAKKDYIRAQIMSRKINPKVLDDKEFQEERIKYYTYMVDYYFHEHSYLNIYRSYQSIYTTPSVQESPDQKNDYLRNCVLYIVLSPHGNEQHDLMHRLAEDRGLENLPAFKGLLKKFMTLELMNWEELTHAAAKELESLEVFKSTRREEVMTDWKQRVIEHNLRTIAKYYSKIELPRLAQLLELSEEAAEKNLSELVVSKSVFARIDRIKGEINFVKKQDAPDVLNDWAHDIASLLKSVEKTCHLIQRENMVHGIDAS